MRRAGQLVAVSWKSLSTAIGGDARAADGRPALAGIRSILGGIGMALTEPTLPWPPVSSATGQLARQSWPLRAPGAEVRTLPSSGPLAGEKARRIALTFRSENPL